MILLGKMGIVMAHNLNIPIEWLGQSIGLLRLINVQLHDIGDVMFWVVLCVNLFG